MSRAWQLHQFTITLPKFLTSATFFSFPWSHPAGSRANHTFWPYNYSTPIWTTNHTSWLPICSHLCWQTPDLLQRSVYIGVVGHSSQPFSEPCQQKEEGQQSKKKVINMIDRRIKREDCQDSESRPEWLTDRQHRARDTVRYACPSRHGRVGSAELLLIQQSDEQNNKSKTADGTEISVLVHPCLIKILGLYHMLVSRNPQLYSLLPYRGMYEESFPPKKKASRCPWSWEKTYECDGFLWSSTSL